MPKNKNLLKIPELTRSGYRAFFDNFDESWVFEENYPLSKKEIEVIEAVRKELGQDAQIFAVRRVEKPDGVKMPDLIVNGQAVEIKIVSSPKTAESQTSKAKKQGSKGVFYHLTEEKGYGIDLLNEEVKKRASNANIKNIITTKKNAAGSYARIDSALNDLIIPQNIQKVKKLNEKTPLSSLNPDELGIKIHNSIKLNSPHAHGYWQNRAIANFERNEADTGAYSRRIARIYADSERKIITEIKKLYANYYRSDNTFDLQALNSIEPAGNVAKFKAEMKRLGLKTHLPDNYAFRMTRLEMLQNQLWAEIKSAGFKHTDAQTASATSTIKNSYGRAITDAERKFGSIGAFAKLDNQTLTRILNSKIEGAHFSSRIWKNTDVLAEHISSKLASAIAIGQSPEKTIREIRERFGVAQSSAERLIRTETNYFENRGELAAYQELGIEEFEFLAALDGRTSEICRHHHGKRYKVEKGKSGENIPPLHPNCRSTIVAVVPELESAPVVETSSQDRGVSKAKPLDEPQIKNSFKENASTAYKSGDRPRFKQDHAKIQAFVEELGRIESKTAKELRSVIYGNKKSARIARISDREISKLSNLGIELSSGAQLFFSGNTFRHLINSGHITGQGVNSRKDKNPLSARDLANIKEVFKHPEKISRSDRNGEKLLKYEKYGTKRQRLILEVAEKDNKLFVKTFFNVS